jgi:hypothetical protein
MYHTFLALAGIVVGVLVAPPTAFAGTVTTDKPVQIGFDEDIDATSQPSSWQASGVACGRMQAEITLDTTTTADTTFAGTIDQLGEAGAWSTVVTIASGVFALPSGRQEFRVNPSAAPAAGAVALVTFKCQEQFTSLQKAPGINGTAATMETLRWIWGLQRVPFPQAIDDGTQWTDYYFSHDAGGLWPLGDDSVTNANNSPEAPWATLAKWKTECFTAFVRCNDDPGDNRDDAGGGADVVFGIIEDADVDITGCPTSSFIAAHEQPCFWWRSGSPDTEQLWDFQSVALGVEEATLDLATITKRAHLLIEGISIIGEDTHLAGVGTGPIDTHEQGMISYVGKGTLTYSGLAGGTANIFSAHDVSHTAGYGDIDMAYTGGTTGNTSPTVSANVSGSVSVHTNNTPTNCVPCTSYSFNQATGNPDDALDAQALATPLQAFVSGVNFVSEFDAVSNPKLGTITADEDGGADVNRSNDARVLMVATSQELREGAGLPIGTAINSLDDSHMDLTMIYPTFQVQSGDLDSTNITHIGTNFIGASAGNDAAAMTADIDIVIAGAIFEPNNAGSNRGNILHFPDDDLAECSGCSLTMADAIYNDDPPHNFRIDGGGSSCSDVSPFELESCMDADADFVWTYSIDNNFDAITAAETGSITAGSTDTILQMTAETYTVNEWANAILSMTSGTEDLHSRRVASNTATTVTLERPFNAAPAAVDTYQIHHFTNATGICAVDQDVECEGHIAGSFEHLYRAPIPERVQLPSFITGVRATSFDGTGGSNIGRAAPEPWAER